MHLLTDKEQITERIRIVSQKSRASAKSIVMLVLFSCMAFVLWGCGMKQTAVMTESETDTSASEEFSSSHSNGTNDESTVETGSENETGLQETPETENETETGIPETETETEAPQILSREEVILLAKKNLKAQYERFREEQTGEISSTTGIVCLELRVPDIGRYTPGDLVKSFDYYDENMNRILKDTHMNHIFGETDYFTACYISEEEVSLIGYKDTTRADFDSDDNIVMFQIGRDSYVGPGDLTLDFVDYDHDGADELVIKESYSGGDGFYTFMSAWEINREQYLPERSQEFDRLHVDVTEEEDAFVITENDSGFSKRFLKNELDKHGFDIFTIGPGEGFLNGGFCATAKLQETPADGTVEIEMSMPMYGIAPTIEIRYSLYFQDGKWQIRILDCEAI